MSAPPVGNRGVHMVDTGDLAEVAALSLERRLTSGSTLPAEVLEVAEPRPVADDAQERLTEPLGRAPRTYREFAERAAADCRG